MSLNHPATRQAKRLSGTCRNSECDEIAAHARDRHMHSDEVWPFVFEHMLARAEISRDESISGEARAWMVAEYDAALARIEAPELRGALAMGFADSIRLKADSDFPLWMVVDCLAQSYAMTFTPQNVYRLAEDFALVGAAVRAVGAEE